MRRFVRRYKVVFSGAFFIRAEGKLYFPMAKCLTRHIRKRRTTKTPFHARFAVRQNVQRAEQR